MKPWGRTDLKPYPEDHRSIVPISELLEQLQPDPLAQCPRCLYTGSRSEIQSHLKRPHV